MGLGTDNYIGECMIRLGISNEKLAELCYIDTKDVIALKCGRKKLDDLNAFNKALLLNILQMDENGIPNETHVWAKMGVPAQIAAKIRSYMNDYAFLTEVEQEVREKQKTLLHKKLKQARTDTKLSIIFAAKYMGIDPILLEEIESGKKEPTVSQLNKLSKLYGIPVTALVLSPLHKEG